MSAGVHVVGHVTTDRLVREGLRDEVLPGGCVSYAARAHCALGWPVTVTTSGATDAFPPEVTVDRAESATTRFVNTYREGARSQTIEAIGPPLLPRDETVFDALHLAPVLGEVPLDAWLGRGRFMGVGLQGWLRRAEGVAGPGVHVVAGEAPLLRGVDVVFLSDEDLRGQDGLLEQLRTRVPLVALTHGAQGVTLFSAGTELRLPAVAAEERDPTGAGDTFAAGTLHGLANGMPAARAALVGAKLAAACVAQVGLPDVAHLRAALAC